MRRRGFWFKRILILTVLATFSPVILGIGYLGMLASETHQFPVNFHLQNVLGYGQQWNPLSQAAVMIHNRWIWVVYGQIFGGQKIRLHLHSIAPESPRSEIGANVDILGNDGDLVESLELSPEAQIRFPYFSVAGDGQQTFLVGEAGEVLELHEKHLLVRSIKFVKQLIPPSTWPPSGHTRCLVADGKLLMFVIRPDGQYEVFQFQNEAWTSLGTLQLLDPCRVWLDSENRHLFVPLPAPDWISVPGYSVGNNPSVAFPAKTESGTIKLVTIDSAPFLFWHISDGLLFRKGFDVKPPQHPELNLEMQRPLIDESVSALEPTNVIGTTSEWTSVSDSVTAQTQWFPVIVGGKPTVILIDELRRGHPEARAIQLDHDDWKEIGSINVPFGSYFFNSGSLDDGSKAYLVAATLFSGRIKVYALEPSGFRETSYRHESNVRHQDFSWTYPYNGYLLLGVTWIWFQLSSVFLATAAAILMRRDSVEFQCGTRTAELASICTRVCARVVDSAIVIAATGFACVRLHDILRPDWGSLFHAIAFSNYDNDAVSALAKLCSGGLIAFATSIIVLAAMQGRFGFTPGKWIFGLRIVRTTLRECHFARSLYREILLFIDSVNLLTWIPGILSIAFSQHRQRIGDFGADTIVVRARSLRTVDQNAKNES